MQPLRLSPAPGASLAVDHLHGHSPGIIYLHGFSSSRTGQRGERLAAHASEVGRSLHRFDFRGHGESSGTIETTTLSDLIADVHCVLEHAGPSILLGSSLGGMVASWAAAQKPELVEGLVLIAPAFGFLPGIASADPNAGLDQFQFSPRVVADARRYDEASLAGQLSMGVLLVHGAKDEIVPADVSRRFFDEIPHQEKELWIPEDGDHRLDQQFDEICHRMERRFQS